MDKERLSEWSNSYILEFLELFQGEPCIWDPSNPDNRNRNKVAEAWERLQSAVSFECDINDLKRKKNSLMASYRTLVSKKKKMLKSGKASDELLKPTWFAFELMDSFLAPVYLCDDTMDTDTYSPENASAIDEDASGEDAPCERTIPVYRSAIRSSTKNHTNAIKKRKITKSTSGGPTQAVEHMELPYEIVKEVAEPKDAGNEKDDCELYGELLARKLRRFNEDDRESIMLKIDAMLLRKKRQLSVHNSSWAPTFNGLRSPSSEDSSSPTRCVVQYNLKEEDVQ